MHLLYFAHNGIDHDSAVEAATHEPGALLWVVTLTIATVAILNQARKILDKRRSEEADGEED